MSRSKNPLDLLQSMINGILIETGRALSGTNKENGRTFANANARLRTTIPSAIENFHQALDDLESDIVRAKAVLLRDLEELRAQRIAAENPPEQIVEPVREPSMELDVPVENSNVIETQPSPPAHIKEEKMDTTEEASTTIQDTTKDPIPKPEHTPKGEQVPSPPSSDDTKAKPDSDSHDTNAISSAPITTPPTATSGLEDPSIDSLFDIQDNNNTNTSNENNNNNDLTFDSMDFLNDTTQTQASDFDLSTFGDNATDFTIPDTQAQSGGGQNVNTNPSAENPDDDLFGMINAAGGHDMMDLDTSNIRPAEETAFDDMFFGDDGGMGGNQGMTDEFDDAFFTIT